MTTTTEADEEEPTPSANLWDRASEAIDRWSARTARGLFRVGTYMMLPALVTLVTLDVVLRYVFDAPLQWARDVSGLFLLMAISAALPHAWDRAYHIRMEVVYDRFSERRRQLMDVVSVVSGIVFFGMMGVQAARYVPFMVRTGETGEDLLWPLWPYMAFMAVCALVTVARLLANPAPTTHGTPALADAPPPGGTE